MQFLFRYANPHYFMRLSGAVLPFAALATLLCLGIGLYLGFSAPPDYLQGRTVLLLFVYIGYMALWNAIEDEVRAARAAAILALVGAVNIPIIKFSVEWWNTLQQGESIVSGHLAPVFLAPLLLMMAGYFFLFLTLWMIRIRTAILERRARGLMQAGAR
jgi:heme exporter protein C